MPLEPPERERERERERDGEREREREREWERERDRETERQRDVLLFGHLQILAGGKKCITRREPSSPEFCSDMRARSVPVSQKFCVDRTRNAPFLLTMEQEIR